MKGIIFTQFMEMVEEKWGLAMLDELINEAKDPIDGAYNQVDTYDHGQLVNLVIALHKKTKVPVNELLEAYGKYLFGALAKGYPALVQHINNTFDMLESIESVIHTEVRKLYPEANPPRFDSVRINEHQLKLTYRSHRSMADVAQGLMYGCAAHFNEKIEVKQMSADSDGQKVEFLIEKIVE